MDPANRGEKYCRKCRKMILEELREAGYLQYVPHRHERTQDQKELTRETKRGTEQG
jgi:hypothetical protein